MLYERALSESKQLGAKIQTIQSLLEDLPSGDFFCTRHEKYSKWYHNTGTETKYLSKKERPLAEQLAQKKYLSYLLEDMKHEKIALDFYLRHHATGKNPQLPSLQRTRFIRSSFLPSTNPNLRN